MPNWLSAGAPPCHTPTPAFSASRKNTCKIQRPTTVVLANESNGCWRRPPSTVHVERGKTSQAGARTRVSWMYVCVSRTLKQRQKKTRHELYHNIEPSLNPLGLLSGWRLVLSAPPCVLFGTTHLSTNTTKEAPSTFSTREKRRFFRRGEEARRPRKNDSTHARHTDASDPSLRTWGGGGV